VQDLRHHVLHEGLTAKSWLDRHYEHHVQGVDDWTQPAHHLHNKRRLGKWLETSSEREREESVRRTSSAVVFGFTATPTFIPAPFICFTMFSTSAEIGKVNLPQLTAAHDSDLCMR
jgi:hypothetical protein